MHINILSHTHSNKVEVFLIVFVLFTVCRIVVKKKQNKTKTKTNKHFNIF